MKIPSGGSLLLAVAAGRKPRCPHCGSKHVERIKPYQCHHRYYCHDCGRYLSGFNVFSLFRITFGIDPKEQIPIVFGPVDPTEFTAIRWANQSKSVELIEAQPTEPAEN